MYSIECSVVRSHTSQLVQKQEYFIVYMLFVNLHIIQIPAANWSTSKNNTEQYLYQVSLWGISY